MSRLFPFEKVRDLNPCGEASSKGSFLFADCWLGVTVYAEYQYTKNLVANFDDFDQDLYTNKHLALSYYFNKIGNITYLMDEEIKTNYIDNSSKKNIWDGMELSLKLSSTMQLSIFKGSQKGGLVCANGVCAVQPSFENGTKITFRALF